MSFYYKFYEFYEFFYYKFYEFFYYEFYEFKRSLENKLKLHPVLIFFNIPLSKEMFSVLYVLVINFNIVCIN